MYHYITIGYDCSPAAALRNLEKRDQALPFDWVVSTIPSLNQCFREGFARFHSELRWNHNKSRLIDAYGFQFPHDYPLQDTKKETSEIGEGIFGEEAGKTITDDWMQYYPIVKEKYERRIQRFFDIMRDPKPVIVLCRYSNTDVLSLQYLLASYYQKTNIVFINSCSEPSIDRCIFNCNTEANGEWNETQLWQKEWDKVMESKLFL